MSQQGTVFELPSFAIKPQLWLAQGLLDCRDDPAILLVADRDVRVVSAEDGELLRHLTLDPSRDYQRQSA